MRTHLNLFFAVFLTALLLVACDNVNNNVTLPGSTGKAGEIIVVISNSAWDGLLGKAIYAKIAEEHPALPQPEPLFNLSNLPNHAFNKILKTHRNILFVELKSDADSVTLQKNIWAKDQVVVTIYAQSSNAALSLFNNNSSSILLWFINGERRRLMKKFASIKSVQIGSIVKKSIDVDLGVPKDYKAANRGENFVWLRKETGETSQGLLLYSYPYIDSSSFNLTNLMDKRDALTKSFVPGPAEGSHMATMRDFPAIGKQIEFNGNYAVEVRGLWMVKGDFMGGPFISYSIHDLNKNRIVCVEGYVYAPKFNKRNYLREVEAILLTLKL